MSRVQVYSSYTQRASPTVQSFHLSTSSILLILTTQVIQKLESINLNILDPPTQPNPQATHNQRSHNKPLSSNKSNQSLPDYVKSSTNNIITDHTHTELNQEVDMQRYIFLITYDVLVSGKMAGYYMMSMMVTCITCFNYILWTSTRDLWSRWWIVR